LNSNHKTNGFELVRKPSSAIEKAAPGAKRILAGMMAETIVLAETKALIELSPNKSPRLESWCKKGEDCHANLCNRGENYPASSNFIDAEKWLRMAAEKGHTRAQFRLGEFHRMGFNCYFDKVTGEARDKAEAEKWIRIAANQGLAEAQHLLARCYLDGIVVPKDNQEGLRWLNKSVEQGCAEAQYFLARLYMSGSSVPQDYHEAIRWLSKAAEQNHFLASLTISECYEALGNLVEAYKWLLLAGEQDGSLEEEFNSLRSLLTEEQIVEAEMRYREFQSSKK
jgi:TPR repeat protein